MTDAARSLAVERLIAALNQVAMRSRDNGIESFDTVPVRVLADAIIAALDADGWTLVSDGICRHIWHDNVEPVDGLCPRCGAGKWPASVDPEVRGGYVLDGYYGDPNLRAKHGDPIGDAMTLLEAAAILEVTAATLRQQIANVKLKATKRGRDWWVTRREVTRYQRDSRRVR